MQAELHINPPTWQAGTALTLPAVPLYVSKLWMLLLAVLLLPAVRAAQPTVPSPAWTTYTGDGQFSVDMPSPPVKKDINGQTYAVASSPGVKYYVTYKSVTVASHPRAVLDGAVEALKENQDKHKVDIKSRRDTAFMGYPGTDLVAEVNGNRSQIRLILVAGRLYELAAVAVSDQLGPDVQTFLDSFRPHGK